MRILVADRNSLLLAAITATFGQHCDLVTATRRDVCLGVLDEHRFDVVIACDKLSDYTGLELLSEVPVVSPDTLLIFAADPKRLKQLEKRLAVFGLFDTLSYPLTPQKFVDVLKRARECLLSRRTSAPSAPVPELKVRHVVLEPEWDTGERLGLVELELQAESGEQGAQSAHDGWSNLAEDGGSDHDGPGDDTPDDFVFEGPVQGTSGAPTAGRTFEGTPIAHDAGSAVAHAGAVTAYEVKPVADPGAVQQIRNEAIAALTHENGSAQSSPADEFVFAIAVSSGVDPRASGSSALAHQVRPTSTEADRVMEVEPRRVPDTPERTNIDNLVCNDPVFDVPQAPKWAEDGAANDKAFEPKPAASGARTTAAADTDPGYPGGDASDSVVVRTSQDPRVSTSQASGDAPASTNSSKPQQATKPAPSSKERPQPRVRAQSVPTPSQLAAFERAMARRLAAQKAGPSVLGTGAEKAAPSGKGRKNPKGRVKAEPTIGFAKVDAPMAGGSASDRPSKSLSELAKMAISKRPLSVPNLSRTAVPKRAMFAVSSGLAAVLILGVLSFELLRNSNEAQHHMPRAQSLQAFSPASPSRAMTPEEMAAVQVFAAPPGQTGSPSDLPPDPPQAQTFDPDTAPPDPPPPPPVDQLEPIEPPSSMDHSGPPQGMMPNSDGTSE
jgi:hypothetical protein